VILYNDFIMDCNG